MVIFSDFFSFVKRRLPLDLSPKAQNKLKQTKKNYSCCKFQAASKNNHNKSTFQQKLLLLLLLHTFTSLGNSSKSLRKHQAHFLLLWKRIKNKTAVKPPRFPKSSHNTHKLFLLFYWWSIFETSRKIHSVALFLLDKLSIKRISRVSQYSPPRVLFRWVIIRYSDDRAAVFVFLVFQVDLILRRKHERTAMTIFLHTFFLWPREPRLQVDQQSLFVFPFLGHGPPASDQVPPSAVRKLRVECGCFTFAMGIFTIFSCFYGASKIHDWSEHGNTRFCVDSQWWWLLNWAKLDWILVSHNVKVWQGGDGYLFSSFDV